MFDCSVDDLTKDLGCRRKDAVVRFICKNFKENTHYIVVNPNKSCAQHGGQNKNDLMMTAEAYNLCKTSFNMKNKYLPKFANVEQVRIIMSLENQTIGFIASAFDGVTAVERQARIGTYKVDLLFNDHRLVVECDENGHANRDVAYEQQRESYIKTTHNMVRFNPNDPAFDMALVLRQINKVLMATS